MELAVRPLVIVCLIAGVGAAGCYEHDPGPPTGFADEGDPCLSDDWCRDDLRCEYESCRSTCLRASDCPGGVTCVAPLEAWRSRVCTLAEENDCTVDEDCPHLLYCGMDAACHEPCGFTTTAGFIECAEGYECMDELCYELP